MNGQTAGEGGERVVLKKESRFGKNRRTAPKKLKDSSRPL